MRPRYSASGQRAATTQAAHAFDAGINTRSFWESDGAKPGHWLCVDFGEATTYNEIHVYFNQLGPDDKSISPNAIVQFQKSDDGKTWTNIVFSDGKPGRALSPMERERRDGSYFFVRQALNPAHKSRHLRLFFPSGQVAGVHELEVYNIASSSQLEALQNAGAKINEVTPGAIPPPLSATPSARSNPNPVPSAATATPRPAGAARPVENFFGPISSVRLNDAGDSIGPMAVPPGSGMRGSTDPYVIRDGGYYYYARTENETSVTVSKARRLEDIGKVGKTTVWKPDFAQFSHLRSPRLHKAGNKWYLYVSASDGDGHRDNRNTPLNLWNDDYHFGVYALEGSSPLGPFEFKGLVTKVGQWAADGTILVHPGNGKNYFVWSGRLDEDTTDAKNVEPQMRPRCHRQALYIAEMDNPWTLKGERRLISEPTLDFEKGELNNAQVAINEGPAVAIRNDGIYIFYSANAGTNVHSSIGMLKASAKSDLLLQASWAKSKNPIFWGGTSTTIDNAEGVFYVRQPCLVKSPDGKEDWLLYQAGARSYGDAVGNPANVTQMRQYLNSKKDRSVRLQKLVWRKGVPAFAVAIAGSAELAGNAAMRGQTFKRPSGTASDGIYVIEAEDATLTGVINPDDRTTADVDFKSLRAKTGIVGQWQRGGNPDTAGPQDGARGGFGTYWNASNGLAVRLGKDGTAKFEVKIAKAGIYELSVIGVALEYGAKQIVAVNGTEHEMTHALYSQRYGGLFTPQSLTVKLNVGNNVIIITNKPGSLGAVIDYIYLSFLRDDAGRKVP
jgi:GH43 family beta-xylosidase